MSRLVFLPRVPPHVSLACLFPEDNWAGTSCFDMTFLLSWASVHTGLVWSHGSPTSSLSYPSSFVRPVVIELSGHLTVVSTKRSQEQSLRSPGHTNTVSVRPNKDNMPPSQVVDPTNGVLVNPEKDTRTGTRA